MGFYNLNAFTGSTGHPAVKCIRTGMVLAFVIAAFAVETARGGVAYLAAVGPAPLRFELLSAESADWKALFPLKAHPVEIAVAVTNTASNVVAKASAATNTVNLAAVPAAPPVMMVPMQPDEADGNITPQILANYFRPVPGWRRPDGRGPDDGGPPPVWFMPPTPSPTVEQRATYKTQ